MRAAIAASIEAMACRRTGALVVNRGWKVLFIIGGARLGMFAGYLVGLAIGDASDNLNCVIGS